MIEKIRKANTIEKQYYKNIVNRNNILLYFLIGFLLLLSCSLGYLLLYILLEDGHVLKVWEICIPTIFIVSALFGCYKIIESIRMDKEHLKNLDGLWMGGFSGEFSIKESGTVHARTIQGYIGFVKVFIPSKIQKEINIQEGKMYSVEGFLRFTEFEYIDNKVFIVWSLKELE